MLPRHLVTMFQELHRKLAAKRRRGFTILELLLVISILAILMGVAMRFLNIRGILVNAEDAARKNAENQLERALYQHIVDTSQLAGSITEIPKPICAEGVADGTDGCVNIASLLVPQYLPKLPERDPAGPNPNLLGYKVSLENYRPRVVASYLGQSAGSVDPLTEGLVAHWKFDETSGATAADSSSNTLHGTLENGPAWSGIAPLSLSFDGTDDYVSVPDVPILRLQVPLSFSAWVKPGSVRPVAKLFSRGNAGGYYYFYLEGNRAGCGSIYGSNTTEAVSNTTALTVGVWTHVACIADPMLAGTARIKIYQSGAEITDKFFVWTNGFGSTDTQSRIGKSFDASYFHGSLDELRIYNRALSAGEVSMLSASH